MPLQVGLDLGHNPSISGADMWRALLRLTSILLLGAVLGTLCSESIWILEALRTHTLTTEILPAILAVAAMYGVLFGVLETAFGYLIFFRNRRLTPRAVGEVFGWTLGAGLTGEIANPVLACCLASVAFLVACWVQTEPKESLVG
jgi:hypothetical protein